MERLQIGRAGGGQLGRAGGEGQQVHVEVAGGRGEVAQPLELGPVHRGQAVRQQVGAQLQGAPGAPHRNAQVVQELGVDVADRARDVRLQGVEQPQQHGGERHAGGHRGGQFHVDLARVLARRAARGGQDRVQRRQRRGEYPGLLGQALRDPVGLSLVAAHRGERKAGRRVGGSLAGRVQAVHGEPGHRLVVGVAQPELRQRARGLRSGQQRPHRRQALEPVPQRSAGEPFGHGRPAGPVRFRRDPLAGRAAQDQFGRPAAGHALQREPGPVQPPVEGVQPGAPQGARPGGGHHREPRRQCFP